MLALLSGCDGEETKTVQAEVVCQATIEDVAGVAVATLEDTVPVLVHTTTSPTDTLADSVGGDPRPCKVVAKASGYLVLNAKDSATGNPKP